MALAFFVTGERMRLATERRRVAAADLDALSTGIEVLEQARREAVQIRQQAQAQAQQMLREARNEAEARVQAQAAQAINALAANASRVLRQLEHVLVEVVVSAVGRLVAQGDPGATLAAAVREVVAQSADLSFATLKVSPADAGAAADEVRRLTRGQNLPQTIAVRADPQLAPGECVLLSEVGKLRLRLDLQMQVLREALSGALRLDDSFAAHLLDRATAMPTAGAGAAPAPAQPPNLLDAALKDAMLRVGSAPQAPARTPDE
jgi:type III secretion protein L